MKRGIISDLIDTWCYGPPPPDPGVAEEEWDAWRNSKSKRFRDWRHAKGYTFDAGDTLAAVLAIIWYYIMWRIAYNFYRLVKWIF